MNAGGHDRCPRCGGGFHCGVADAGPCACTTLRLAPALLDAIGRRWQGCLCLACLAALAAGEPLEGVPAASGAQPPAGPGAAGCGAAGRR